VGGEEAEVGGVPEDVFVGLAFALGVAGIEATVLMEGEDVAAGPLGAEVGEQVEAVGVAGVEEQQEVGGGVFGQELVGDGRPGRGVAVSGPAAVLLSAPWGRLDDNRAPRRPDGPEIRGASVPRACPAFGRPTPVANKDAPLGLKRQARVQDLHRKQRGEEPAQPAD
jgi:hypothetical protein